MDHCVRPDANSNSKPDFGSVNFTCLRVRQFIGDMELLMYQQQQRVAELEDKHKQCKCKHDTQAMAHLAEKVAYLEDELKCKEIGKYFVLSKVHILGPPPALSVDRRAFFLFGATASRSVGGGQNHTRSRARATPPDPP